MTTKITKSKQPIFRTSHSLTLFLGLSLLVSAAASASDSAWDDPDGDGFYILGQYVGDRSRS